MDALKLSHVCKEYGDFSLKNVRTLFLSGVRI